MQTDVLSTSQPIDGCADIVEGMIDGLFGQRRENKWTWNVKGLKFKWTITRSLYRRDTMSIKGHLFYNLHHFFYQICYFIVYPVHVQAHRWNLEHRVKWMLLWKLKDED